jgi:hypothetical protein
MNKNPNIPNLKIDALYAYLAQTDDGYEGVMAMSVPVQPPHNNQMIMLPMVGADVDRIKSLLPIAKQIALASGLTFRIYRFDNKVEITDEIELG